MVMLRKSFRRFDKLFTLASKLILIILIITLGSPITLVRADTSVCGPIDVDTTWMAAGNNYVVTCDVQVLTDVTLTIENGVIVKFDDGTGLRIDGELIATGVTFTSSNPNPTEGIWKNIYFTVTSVDAVFDDYGNYVSGSIIQDSMIEWGGGGDGVNGEIDINGASPFIDHNTIRTSLYRGVYAVGRSSQQKVVINRNNITNNAHGGVYVSAGTLTDNTISNNYCTSCSNHGNGAYVVDSVMTGNLVSSNSGYYGGGIYSDGSVLTENTVSGNSGKVAGGGIYAVGGSITDNVVTGNTLGAFGYPGPYTAYGGGIYITGGTLTDNVVSGNTCSDYEPYNLGHSLGGGIYASLSVLSDNKVSSNSAIGAYSYGGGIYSEGGTITGNTIEGNTANTRDGGKVGRGGGIYIQGGSSSGNKFNNNTLSGGSDLQGGGIYASSSTTNDNTFTGNSANRGGAIYAYQGTVSNNSVLTNTATTTGAIYMEGGSAAGNILKGNTATNGGGLFGRDATLTGNTVEGNTALLGGGILSEDSTVLGNTVIDNTALSEGGGIYALRGTVTGNTIIENTAPSYGHGSGAYVIDVTDFSYNDVVENIASGGTAGGVSVSGQPMLHYNNIYGNLPYDVEVVSDLAVDATFNYWGLSACTAIPNQIYDGYDAPGRGYLSYAPSLYSEVPVAQLAAPTELTLTKGETSVTLNWTPIAPLPDVGCRVPGSPSPDLGYLLYYGDDACAPYDGTGLPAGDSPIDVGEDTTLILSGISDTGMYFAVTAYDYLERQSAYSNVVSTESEAKTIFLPFLVKK
jgi:predicted outer membrane repeat protein